MPKIHIACCALLGTLLLNCTPQAPPEINEGELLLHNSAVYYKTIGTGEPLLIIHGGPVLDHSYLLPSFEALAEDYQLVFYDQRASGRSSAEVDSSSMTLAAFVEDIELVRQALQLEKVHLLGHSWGGLLAMHYAIAYPEQLRSLILSNSMPAASDKWQEEEAQLAQRVTPADSLARWTIINSGELQSDPAAAVRKLMLLSFKTQFHDPKLVDSLPLWIPDDYMARSQALQRLGPDLASFDLYDELAKVQTPTLILYGAHEPAATLSGRHLAERMPQAELKIIEKSGHFPFVEQPRVYFEAIETFIKEY